MSYVSLSPSSLASADSHRSKLSDLLLPIYPVKLIRFNIEKEEPIRDPKTGFCIPCKPGEGAPLLLL